MVLIGISNFKRRHYQDYKIKLVKYTSKIDYIIENRSINIVNQNIFKIMKKASQWRNLGLHDYKGLILEGLDSLKGS